MQNGRDARAEQLYRLHHLRLRQRTRVHLKSDAGDSAQRFAVSNNLLRHFVGVTDQQRPEFTALRIKIRAGHGSPAALLSDVGERALVAGKEFIGSLLRRRRHVAERVDSDFELLG